MQTKPIKFNRPLGAFLFVMFALAAWALCSAFIGGVSLAWLPYALLAVALLCALAGIKLLWRSRAWIVARAAPLLLCAGLLILAVCFFLGTFLGIAAGGFIAITGAILTLGKK